MSINQKKEQKLTIEATIQFIQLVQTMYSAALMDCRDEVEARKHVSEALRIYFSPYHVAFVGVLMPRLLAGVSYDQALAVGDAVLPKPPVNAPLTKRKKTYTNGQAGHPTMSKDQVDKVTKNFVPQTTPVSPGKRSAAPTDVEQRIFSKEQALSITAADKDMAQMLRAIGSSMSLVGILLDTCTTPKLLDKLHSAGIIDSEMLRSIRGELWSDVRTCAGAKLAFSDASLLSGGFISGRSRSRVAITIKGLVYFRDALRTALHKDKYKALLERVRFHTAGGTYEKYLDSLRELVKHYELTNGVLVSYIFARMLQDVACGEKQLKMPL